MRQNYSGNKRRKEELRKKKQEQKRNKRLQKNVQPGSPDAAAAGSSGVFSATFSAPAPGMP